MASLSDPSGRGVNLLNSGISQRGAMYCSASMSTVVAIQFLPLMAVVALISTFTWRRTGSYVPGAVICGLFVTWYVVAGTATQVV